MNDILDSLGEGIFTVDKEFRITFVNRAGEKMLGVKRNEAIGRFCKDVLRSQYCVGQCPIARVLETGENIYDRASSITNEHGMLVPIRLNAAVLRNGSNESAGGVVSFRDLSLDASCEPCVKIHTRRARTLGATQEEVAETIGVAVVMVGGPSDVWPRDAIMAELEKPA